MDRFKRIGIWALALALSTTMVMAQETEPAAAGADQAAMMAAWQKSMTPGEPHADLARSAGKWKTTTQMWMDPAGEPMVSEGVSERQMILGGRVLEERLSGNVMGMPFEGIARTGYNNVTGMYWSTWIDNMSTSSYMAHGTRDAEADAVTYHGAQDNPMTGGKTKVRSVVRWLDENSQQFEWYEDHGGGEIMTMTITYERADS